MQIINKKLHKWLKYVKQGKRASTYVHVASQLEMFEFPSGEYALEINFA